MGLFGFQFFPVLDDWVQYSSYSIANHPWQNVFLAQKLYSFRPLAGLLDLYFWCRITPFAPFLIILLHTASCILFIRAAHKCGIRLGAAFIIIYMFLPINSEATMWLSAATRIVVPIFLISVALNIALGSGKPEYNLVFKNNEPIKKSFPTKKILQISAFAFVQLCSLAFYEQVALLSIAMCLLIALWKKEKRWAIITAFNTAIIGIYYLIFFKTGLTADRTAMQLTASEQAKIVWGHIVWGLIPTQFQLIANGLQRGCLLLLRHGLYLILVVAASIFFADAMHKKHDAPLKWFRIKNAQRLKIIIGAALFLIPYVPFLFMSENLVAYRNIFPSLIGFGLLIDGLCGLAPKFEWQPQLIMVAVFLCLLVGISESADYRAVSLTDRAFAQGLLPQMMQEWLFQDRIPTLTVQNITFGEHILNATSSGWALTAAGRAISGNLQLPTVKVMWN